MNYYSHHLGDYLRDAGHLSMIEDGAYRRLIDAYYIRECALPLCLRECQKLVRATTTAEKKAVLYVLSKFFTIAEDGYHQKRCDGEIEAAHKRIEAAKSNGKKGGRPRLSGNPGETQEKPTGLMLGTPTLTQEKALQSPISNLQEERHVESTFSGRANGSHAAIPTDVEQVFDHWRSEWGHPSAKLDPKRTKAIKLALKSYTVDELRTAISGYRKSPHHTGSNDRKTVYDALTLLLRDNDHIDAGIKFAGTQEKTQWM